MMGKKKNKAKHTEESKVVQGPQPDMLQCSQVSSSSQGSKSKKKKKMKSQGGEPKSDVLKNDAKQNVAKNKKPKKKFKRKLLEEKDNEEAAPSKKLKTEDIKTEELKEEEDVKLDLSFVNVSKSRDHCLVKVKQGEHWHNLLKDSEPSESSSSVSVSDVSRLSAYAEALFDAEVRAHHSKPGSKDGRWMQSVMQKGTLTDKISANVVTLQEAPVHNLSILQNLISMVSIKSRRPCMMAVEALKELFPNHLLKPDKKLQTMAQKCNQHLVGLNQSCGNNKDTRDRTLILWHFEAKLKDAYATFLDALDQVAKDTLEKSKVQAMTAFLDLLIANPEQEQTLLARLVNKLGDPVRGVAAKATYQLGKLLEAHPAMRQVVLQEVEQLLYRSNVSGRAQYYGICCLIQLVLREDDVETANKLISIYFAFFKLNAAKKEIDTKLVSALLTGVNRAYPYAKIEGDKVNEHVETMFKIIHTANFNTSLQALMLVYQLVQDSAGSSLSDRFYTAFYKKVLDPAAASSNKQALFLNLTHRAIKSDPSDERAACFIRRLVQVSHYMQPHLVCSLAFLISETLKAKPSLKQTFATMLEGPSGGQADVHKWDSDGDEEEEHYKDADADDDQKASPKVKSSWVFKDLKSSVVPGPSGKPTTTGTRKDNVKYDPEHRNPLFGCATREPAWEMATMATQFHPSAQLFAKNLLDSEAIAYSGDPLQDFTLMRFLDRFVFRNPKKDPGKGRPHTVFSKRNVYKPTGVKSIAPDSKEYLEQNPDQIPPDERFIYAYLKEKAKYKADEHDSDAESVNSDDFDAALDEDRATAADTGGDVDDIDFAGALDQEALEDDDDEENEDESTSEEDEEEEEGGFEEVDDFSDLSDDDFDPEEKEDDDDQSDGEIEELPEQKKVKPSKTAKSDKRAAIKDKRLQKLKKLGSDPNLMASAEEFADLIEQYQDDDAGLHGTFEDVANTNKSSAKQLKWEKKRHHDAIARGGSSKFKKANKKFKGAKKSVKKK